MAYLDSIVMNGRAELGNLSGWNVSGVVLSQDTSSRFRLEATAYMQQDIPSVLYSKPSVDYLIALKYCRLSVKDPLNLVTDAYATIRFKYLSGKEDVVTMPLQSYNTTWQNSEVAYTHLTDEKLQSIMCMVQTSSAVGGMLIDDIEILPSDNLITKEAGPENNTEKFKELSILYGPEANLPELG